MAEEFDLEMKDYRDDDGRFPPGEYLSTLDALLIEDASDWTESNPVAIRLLAEAEAAPTAAQSQTVEKFRALFCERFPSKVMETSSIPFDLEIAGLRQRSEESLAAYYKRVTSMLQRVGVRDRPAPSSTITSLSAVESIMLDMILRAFIRGLLDHNIRVEATRGMASQDRSLRSVYHIAEEARRINEEIQRLYDEESKTDELQFYKDLVQKNLPQHQLASLLASLQASKQSQAQKPPHYQRWSFHSDQSQQLSEPPAGAFRSRFQPQQYQSANDHRPSYQSEAPPALAHNPSKGNVGRGGFTNSNRWGQYQPTLLGRIGSLTEP